MRGKHSNLTDKEIKAMFKKYMRPRDQDKVHSLYSASSMKRTLICPGSIREIKKAPKQKDNIYSVRGTNTHTLLEFIMEEGEIMIEHPLANEFKRFIGFDREMLAAVLKAKKFIDENFYYLNHRNGISPALLVEQKLPLNDVVNEDCGGTADIILHSPFSVLHVMDYKNGKSLVEAEENKQMMTYALGALHKYGWNYDGVWMSVVQPNAPHKYGYARTWKTTIDRMDEFEHELKYGIELTKKPNAPLVESSECYFCPAKDICPERRKKKDSAILERFKRPDNVR